MRLSVHAHLSKRFDQPSEPPAFIEALRHRAAWSPTTDEHSSSSSAVPRPGPAVAARIDDLLARLTLAEKVALLHQHQAAVPRLGLAAFRTGTEALHGVAWLGPATVFPQAVGLAATWNPDLVRAVGAAVGDEVRGVPPQGPGRRRPQRLGAGGQPAARPALGPQRGGLRRGPVAHRRARRPRTAAGCAATTRRTCKTAPTLKHFLAYNNETDRCTTSSNLPPRVLHEYELPAFRAPIEAGAAVAVMASYNLVNGRPAHLSPLINDELRTWTDDDLLVVSDAGAPANMVEPAAVPPRRTSRLRRRAEGRRRQLHPGRHRRRARPSQRLTEALDRGLLTEADVDTAGRHVLAIRFRLGEFDPAELDPYRGAHRRRRQLPDAPAAGPGGGPAGDRAAQARMPGCCRSARPTARRRDRPARGHAVRGLVQRHAAVPVTARDGTRRTARRGAVEYCEGVDRIALRIAGRRACLERRRRRTVLRSQDRDAGAFDLFDWGGDACALRVGAERPARDRHRRRRAGRRPARPERLGGQADLRARSPRAETRSVLRHLHSGRYVRSTPTARCGRVGRRSTATAFERRRSSSTARPTAAELAAARRRRDRCRSATTRWSTAGRPRTGSTWTCRRRRTGCSARCTRRTRARCWC